jgi:hypothetical protein
MNITNDKTKWILLIGGILVFVVCALLFGGGNLLRGLTNPPAAVNQPGAVPPGAVDDSGGTSVQLGQVVTARSIASGNRPVEVTNQFSQNEPVIYTVVEGQAIPMGTRIFARWSREGQPFEDTNEIVADRDYQGTFIEFHIQPDNVILMPGNYTVQVFVNGNPGPQAQFTVS